MRVYYNEIDEFCATWLRELMKAKQIPDGEIDTRSIADVRPDDLRDFTQCHFFAGIGGWAEALRLARWPDDREVWTGSCPCQPYSVASVAVGGAQGQADERDLWPVFGALIEECRPRVVFGEQVRAAIGWGWWDTVAMALERADYAVAPIVLRADAFGADHERKRLYWVADSGCEGREGHRPIERLPIAAAAAQSIDGDPLARARRALAGDYRDLLPCDGLSVVLERDALKGYGNAIVPQVAQVFIESYLDLVNQ